MDNKKRYKIHGKHKGNLASRVSDFVIVLILSANQFLNCVETCICMPIFIYSHYRAGKKICPPTCKLITLVK